MRVDYRGYVAVAAWLATQHAWCLARCGCACTDAKECGVRCVRGLLSAPCSSAGAAYNARYQRAVTAWPQGDMLKLEIDGHQAGGATPDAFERFAESAVAPSRRRRREGARTPKGQSYAGAMVPRTRQVGEAAGGHLAEVKVRATANIHDVPDNTLLRNFVQVRRLSGCFVSARPYSCFATCAGHVGACSAVRSCLAACPH